MFVEANYYTVAGLFLCPNTYITPAATPITVTTIGSICSKCGIIKKSGKISCCAPGGAWFNHCGSGVNVEHTWFEGLQACKGNITAYRM